jgi:two-component system NarL family response regulator
MSTDVYLISDHILFRNGLHRLLRRETDLRIVGEGEMGPDLVERVRRSRANVVLLAVDSAGVASGPAAQRLYRATPLVPVLVLLMGHDSDDALDALRLGARGILDKNADGTRLVQAIRQAITGEITITPRLATRLVADYAELSRGRRTGSRAAELSDREIDVLALLAAGQTNQQIADRLCVSVHTVRAHLRSVMQKLGVKNRVQAAAYALTTGIRLTRQPDWPADPELRTRPITL